jgi:hypothetical protein
MELKDKKKKPDLVVWDEIRGYYQKELTYGSDIAAPSIKIEDIDGWKQSQVYHVNKLFSTKYEEIKQQLLDLYEEIAWNELVYKSEIRFTPVVGEMYYLYKREDNSIFLSIITPEEWTQELIGVTKIDTNNKWTKV